MKAKIAIFVFTVSLSAAAFAQDNRELAEMYEADQASRRGGSLDFEAIAAQDAEHRTKVMAILSSGNVKTAADYYNAAMIFQHGASADDIRLAHALATISSALGRSDSNWLKAASWDRLMLRFDQPQWYGTQFITDESGTTKLYDVEPNVISDEQRTAWSVPTLEQAEAFVRQVNGNR